jgi:hypothetical protein
MSELHPIEPSRQSEVVANKQVALVGTRSRLIRGRTSDGQDPVQRF